MAVNFTIGKFCLEDIKLEILISCPDAQCKGMSGHKSTKLIFDIVSWIASWIRESALFIFRYILCWMDTDHLRYIESCYPRVETHVSTCFICKIEYRRVYGKSKLLVPISGRHVCVPQKDTTTTTIYWYFHNYTYKKSTINYKKSF